MRSVMRARSWMLGGLSQESFADACGLHRNYMGTIERGEQNVTLKTLQIIARGLNTSVSKLLAGL